MTSKQPKAPTYFTPKYGLDTEACVKCGRKERTHNWNTNRCASTLNEALTNRNDIRWGYRNV